MSEKIIYIISAAITILLFYIPVIRYFILYCFGIVRSMNRLGEKVTIMSLIKHPKLIFFTISAFAFAFHIISNTIYALFYEITNMIYTGLEIVIVPISINIFLYFTVKSGFNND